MSTTTYGIAAPTMPSALYDAPGVDVFDGRGNHIAWLSADAESWESDDTLSYADDLLAAAGYRREGEWRIGNDWIAYGYAVKVTA
jgi:hypothetical protein